MKFIRNKQTGEIHPYKEQNGQVIFKPNKKSIASIPVNDLSQLFEIIEVGKELFKLVSGFFSTKKAPKEIKVDGIPFGYSVKWMPREQVWLSGYWNVGEFRFATEGNSQKDASKKLYSTINQLGLV